MISPYAAMEMLSLIYILIILFSIVVRWNKTEKSTKMFALNILIVMVGIICDILSILNSDFSTKKLSTLIYISLVSGNLIIPIFAYYMMYQMNAKSKVVGEWVARSVFVANALAIAISTVSFIAGKLFVITDAGLAAGIPIYVIYAIDILSMILMTTVLFINIKKMRKRTFISLLILIVFPAITTSVELLLPNVCISYTGISISILLQYVIIQSRLISEAEMREQIENELSRTDVMTGLPNRRAYTEYLEKMTGNVCAGTAFFDLNRLKKTNDEQGHAAGDRLIISFADILREILPHANYFRISGDEFVAIYSGEDNKDVFEEEMANMKSAIVNHDYIASMGYCFDEKENILKIISEAEKNMYEDKLSFYRPEGQRLDQ